MFEKGDRLPRNGVGFATLRNSISGKKFLLVLDDVWTQDYNEWAPLASSLKCGGAGSKILVTTRNERVALVMGTKPDDIYHVQQLSDEDCWLMLLRTSGNFSMEFEDVGKKIAKKCRGLPLAARALGGLLRFRNSLAEWERVLNAELWELESLEQTLFPHLFLTYHNLSPILQNCFRYCAIFPRESLIHVEKLIGNWIALGYLGSRGDLELKGQEAFNTLAAHSLFQDLRRSSDGQIRTCEMNDVIYDFARFLNNKRNVGAKKKACHICEHLPMVSEAQIYRTLFWYDDNPLTVCNCLEGLRVLGIRSKKGRIPQRAENLANLKWLELSDSKLSRDDAVTICKLTSLQFLSLRVQKLPPEIGGLIELRHLDLSSNTCLTELPESMCDLHELRTLNVNFCRRLSKLPQGIHMLTNLRHLFNLGTSCLQQFPQGVAQLVGLDTLNEYCGGSGWSNLGWLKDLNQLKGFLSLKIRLGEGDILDEVVRDAQMAELSKKEHIEGLHIIFEDEMGDAEASLLNALQPHQHLKELDIWLYNGLILPDWITSLGSLRSIKLYNFNHLSSLPSLGMLPLLEEIYMAEMHGLQYVGPEFLGISTISSSVAFPCLKELTFNHCPKWKVWVDITPEEGEYADVQLMPQLIKMTIIGCPLLNSLPPRLLRKASLSAKLNLVNSCWDMDSSATASTSLSVPDTAEVQTQAQEFLLPRPIKNLSKEILIA